MKVERRVPEDDSDASNHVSVTSVSNSPVTQIVALAADTTARQPRKSHGGFVNLGVSGC